jgi:NADH-quinone oxidoreductase subunit J
MPSVLLVQLAAATKVDAAVFSIAAVFVLVGAIGVVVARNPVHAALMLVMTLFGVAVLFVEQQANFLAAVQVIVYAGAIVVLFLFVIMFLGVDRRENIASEPLRAQRPLAAGLVASGLAGLLLLGVAAHWSVGAHSVAGRLRDQPGGDVAALGRAMFTTYLFPFEATAALLVVAVVGAVVLARRPPRARRVDGEDTSVPGDARPSSERTVGYVVGDPMEALAKTVANAVASGLVSRPEDHPEDHPEDQRQEEPVGENTAP